MTAEARTTGAANLPAAPARRSLYTFDPDEVAWLETRMWEAYYARQDLRLFLLLVRLVGSQFGVPWHQAVRLAVLLTRPAMQFAHMVPSADSPHANAPITYPPEAYAFVLPDLTAAFEAVRVVNGARYDSVAVARAELQWWIVHRHPTRYGAGALTEAIAALYAAEYGIPIDRVREAGRLRAEAALVSDAGREGGHVRGAAYWREVHDLLRRSYRSLRAVVDEFAPTAPLTLEGANHYHFVTTWSVAAPIDETWAAISDARTYLEWWPQVYLDVTVDPATNMTYLHTKGALPYHLHWSVTPLSTDPPHGTVLRAAGDFDGIARWILRALPDGGTEITLDWDLNAEKPLLRRFSAIAKPLFAWNHRWAMDCAIAGLDPYLKTQRAARLAGA